MSPNNTAAADTAFYLRVRRKPPRWPGPLAGVVAVVARALAFSVTEGGAPMERGMVLEVVRRVDGRVVMAQTFHDSPELLAENERALAAALREMSVEGFCIAYGLAAD